VIVIVRPDGGRMPVGTTFVTSRTRQWEPSSIEIVNAPGQIERRAMWAGASSSNVVNAAAALIVAALVIAALILGRDFLLPLALATLLSFALQPAVRWLEDYKLPRPAAVALVVLSLIATAVAAGAFLTKEVTGFAEELPRYQENLRTKIKDATGTLGSVGIWRTATEVLRNVGGDLTERPKGGEPVKVEVQNEQSSPFMVFAKYLQLSLSPLTSAALVLLFTIFILLQYHDLRDRIVRVMGPAEIGRSAQALNDAALELAHFFRLQLGLNLAFGIVIGACLWFIGVPNAPLWGAIAAILRFVPYIGGALSALLPMALAAAVEPGWTMLLLTAALFGVAELITAQVIEPVLFGSNTRVSPLAVLLSAAFWTAIWGPVGLILAMPITISLVVFAEHMPMLSFVGVLLGNTPALSPEQRLYHLLLAGDASSSAEEMEDWLEEDRSLLDYLDQVAIPALSIAANDTAREVLQPDQLDKLKDTVSEYVELAEDLIEHRIGQKEQKEQKEHKAAGKLVALAGRLEARVDVTLASGGGLMGINAALQNKNVQKFQYAAVLSVGEATPAQLRLLIRRLNRAISMPIGILMGKDHDNSRVVSEPFAQENIFSSAKALLDKIRASAASPPAPPSAAATRKPIVSVAR
jgi:predicted PurR-regulated permease PerM